MSLGYIIKLMGLESPMAYHRAICINIFFKLSVFLSLITGILGFQTIIAGYFRYHSGIYV